MRQWFLVCLLLACGKCHEEDPGAVPAEAGAPLADAGAPSNSAGGSGDGCAVCTYALENKESNQPFLCRGLLDPPSQILVSGIAFGNVWRSPLSAYHDFAVCQSTDVLALVDGQ